VWSRAWDFVTTEPGTRCFRVLVNGVPMEHESGRHKTQGFAWEKVGVADLAPGKNVIGMRDTSKKWSRPDAILLAPPGFNPAKQSLGSLQQYRVMPVPVAATLGQSGAAGTGGAASVPPPDWRGAKTVAVIESPRVRMSFIQLSTAGAGGAPQIGRRVEIRKDGQWTPAPFAPDAESLVVIYSAARTIDVSAFSPEWAAEPALVLTVGGRDYKIEKTGNPFLAGRSTALSPVSIRQISPDKVVVYYANAGAGGAVLKAEGVWTLDGANQRLSVNIIAPEAGWYSIGFSPFQARGAGEVEFVQSPPLFQMQRLPAAPVMQASASMPHPMALVQTMPAGFGGPVSWTIAAAPDRLPFVWPVRDNSPYGFSLLNRGGQVQGTAFSPVLGLKGSQTGAGETVRADFIAHCVAGGWETAMDDLSRNLFRVTDYREPAGVSLTGAALNMIALLKNFDASGWSPKLRGHYNIESENTASQASPLTVLSASMLTRDAELYEKIALPSLEFTLSRASFHHSPKATHLYVPASAVPLTFSGRAFTSRYWQGVYELTHRKNPWLRHLVTPVDRLKGRKGNPTVPFWAQMLADYQIAPSPEKLRVIEEACDTWMDASFRKRQIEPLGIMPFYNSSFYPQWWDLLDLYELTGKQKYLDAAIEGGWHTVAGLWAHPLAPAGNVTANIGAEASQTTDSVWWKGTEKYRLGFPRKKGDLPAREVPAWLVSPVGLGLEQPLTLHLGRGLSLILNSAWAPSLLRLSAMSDRDLFKTYARNTIIGRFGNYPGYYQSGFTDIQTSPDYPLTGPDITAIYYHHIPVHLAFTLDYLFAEAETLSGGAVSFPYVRQQDYVWFNNREFGHAPGKVYGHAGLWPWLDGKAFSVGSAQVNWLGAVGEGKLDIIVTNSSHGEARSSLRLDLARAGVSGGSPVRLLVDGKEIYNGKVSAPAGAGAVEIPFALPAGKLGVFCFESSLKGGYADAPVLGGTPVHRELPKPWGKFHAARIRGPFGADAIYAFATEMVPKGAAMRLVFEDGSPSPETVTEAPFEISIYPFPMEKSAAFRVEFVAPDGARHETETVNLPGSRLK
jgi:hypothetical protein